MKAAIIALLLILPAMTGAAAGAAPAPHNVPITSLNPPIDAYQSPSLARDPVHPRHFAVAYEEGTNYEDCHLALSADGGATWQNTVFAGRHGWYHAASCGGPQGNGDFNPQVTYGPTGTLYYLFEVPGPGCTVCAGNLYVSVSRDDGASFSAPKPLDPTASPPRAGGFVAYGRSIAIDPDSGAAYIVWRRDHGFGTRPCEDANACGMFTALSQDDGRTFSAPVRVLLPPLQDSEFTLNPRVAAGGGRLYLAWLGATVSVGGFVYSNSASATVYVSSTAIGRQVFGAPVALGVVGIDCLFNCDDLHPNFLGDVQTIAAGSAPNQAVVAWFDPQFGAGTPDHVYVTSSRDGGQSWSSPMIIGTPPQAPMDQQHHPSVTTAPGRVDVVYYDISPDDQAAVLRVSSTDEGRTFSSPVALTDVAFDARIGPSCGCGQTGSGQVARTGSQLGVVATANDDVAVWTDGRRGTRDNGHQDIYFSGSSQPEAPPLAPAPGSTASDAKAGLPNTGAGTPVLGAAVALGLMLGCRRRRRRGSA